MEFTLEGGSLLLITILQRFSKPIEVRQGATGTRELGGRLSSSHVGLLLAMGNTWSHGMSGLGGSIERDLLFCRRGP